MKNLILSFSLLVSFPLFAQENAYENTNQNTEAVTADQNTEAENAEIMEVMETSEPVEPTESEIEIAGDTTGVIDECGPLKGEACVIFKETNRQRKRYRLPPFKYCERCEDMAQEHSNDMRRFDYFSHDRPRLKGRRAETSSQRAHRFGLSNGVGENIAQGADGKTTVQMWMDSRPHRKNILNPKFKYLGVGYTGNYATQVFWKGSGEK